MTADLGSMYRAARHRIAELVDDEVADLPVSGTPSWDVHDVIAHLAGIAEDAVTGNMEGVTTDPWTAAQVERGRGKSISDLIAQWEQHAPAVEAVLSSPQGSAVAAAVIDIHTHECDLLTALGRPVDVPPDTLAWLGTVLRSGFADAVTRAGLPPVEIEADDMEVFRGRLGRRTRAEVCAYGWSADPEPYLDHWFVFGVAERSLGERVAS
jgi:uncharacterized protein (TIGR03083 family)